MGTRRSRAGRAVAALAAAALAAVTGCGGDGSLGAVRQEPVLTAPPGATELLHASGDPEGGGLMGVEQAGWVEVVWASPSPADDVATYYRTVHGARYALYREPVPSEASGDHVFSGLAPKAGDRYPTVRIVIRRERPEVVDADPARLGKAPAGTKSYVTVYLTTG